MSNIKLRNKKGTNKKLNIEADVIVKKKRSVYDGFYYRGEVFDETIDIESNHINKKLLKEELKYIEKKLLSSNSNFHCLLVTFLNEGTDIVKDIIILTTTSPIIINNETIADLVEATIQNSEGDSNNIIKRKFFLAPAPNYNSIISYIKDNKYFLGLGIDDVADLITYKELKPTSKELMVA